ncbi:MAG: hypothetical protein JNG82_14500 [Opitutaceae bacterium]|nr:hypothetical protein [Opitutaceae bacterium]
MSKRRTEGSSEDVRYLGLENIESWTGRLLAGDARIAADEEERSGAVSNCFERGDVLFGKLRPYLAKAHLAEAPGTCTTELLALKPSAKVHGRFLLYALLTEEFINVVDGSTFGSKMPRADWDFIGNQTVPVPSPAQQRAIADYLDRETARLDALVAAKARLLELLAEKRRALITRAVTRGLNPNVPLKESGVEWLDCIPDYWTPTKISRLFRQTKRLGFGDLTVLSVYRDYGVIERTSRDDNANRVPDDLDKYQLVETGDLVINKMKAWQGSLGISSLQGITSPDYVVFSPLHDEDPAYLHLLLRNPLLTTVYLSMSNGIRLNQWRIEPDRFATLKLFLPPLPEQRAIVAHIAAETAKLDALRAAAERSIALLRERRAALIAAAVTGKLALA